jgi:hypothetical protein
VVYDATLAMILQIWSSPSGPFLFLPVDDISTPTIRVSVTTFATQTCQVSVIAFLSDQAVAIDNTLDAGIPVISTPNPRLSIVNIFPTIAAGASATIISSGGPNLRTYAHRTHLSSTAAVGAVPLISVRDSTGADLGGGFLIPGANTIIAETDYGGAPISGAGLDVLLHNYDSVAHQVQGFMVYEQR